MERTLEHLRAFQSRLLMAIHGIAESDLGRIEAANKWSIADVVAHLGDVELVYAVRMRAILAGAGEAQLQALPQNEWVERVHRGREPFSELLEQLWFHRRINLALLERLSDDELARTGDVAARLQRHDEKHLARIERIKSTLGLRATETADVSGVIAGSVRAEHSPGEGVRVRELWSEGARRALEVEFDAGAQWPGIDYHVPGPEEVYVLSGDFDDGAKVYRAGTFLHHPAGSSHSPRSAEGCRLFVFYPEG